MAHGGWWEKGYVFFMFLLKILATLLNSDPFSPQGNSIPHSNL